MGHPSVVLYIVSASDIPEESGRRAARHGGSVLVSTLRGGFASLSHRRSNIDTGRRVGSALVPGKAAGAVELRPAPTANPESGRKLETQLPVSADAMRAAAKSPTSRFEVRASEHPRRRTVHDMEVSQH